jgi:hypothetical protein
MGPDKTIWLAGILIEAAVVGLVFYKRIWRLLPLFCVYLVWDLLSNIVGFASDLHHSAFTNYLTIYFVETVIDSVLQFGVLVEVAWSVLRPIRSSLPRYTLVFVAALILAVGASVWPFVSMTPALAHYVGYAGRVQLVLHLQQTVAILRILFFLALAGCSQLLSIGWRDRELQVATGLGVYSLVSLAVVVLEAHQTSAQNYKTLQHYVIGAFICSLLYWVFSFVQKEAERREFTPQMQSFLLAMAGAARANRTALADSSIADRSFRRKG